MKAVILAGGRGERLRPITDTRPKPLVPVLARPVMDYCLSLLAHHGVSEAYVTTHYLSDQIRHRYGRSAFGMTLFYSEEERPLGTAGGVKLLERYVSDEACFLVMSGDALCDFDLSGAIAFHQEKNADVTIVLSSVKTPLEYGVVLSDTFEKIFAFSEKPDWSETFSDQVNTGVYILSPKVLKKIPEGTPFDFSHDLFPCLLREGYSLFGYKDSGYWCDIGKIPTLYRCNLDLLEGKVKTYLPAAGKTILSSDGEGNCFIADGALVEKGAEVRTGSIVSPGARVAEGSRVSASLILEQAVLERGSDTRSAILCEGARVREGALTLPGTVLGAGSVVTPGAETERGKKYPPFSVVSRVDAFEDSGLVFTESGAVAAHPNGLDGNEAERLGSAFSRAYSQNIAVVWDEKREGSSYFAGSFAGGVVKGGADAILLGEGCEEMASFAARRYCLPTVFISEADGRGVFFGFEEDGFPLVRKHTLSLSRLHEEETSGKTGKMIFREGLTKQYLDALCQEMGSASGKRIGIAGNGAGLLRQATERAGFSVGNETRRGGLGIEIFHRGIKLFLDGEKIADTEKIRLYLVEKELELGKREFVLPETLPALFSEHITNRGGSVRVFSPEQTCRKETAERMQAAKARWLFDQYFLAAYLLSYFKDKSEDAFRKEMKAIPDIYITRLRFLPDEENKARILGQYPREIRGDRSRVRIRPGFYGIRIVSEAMSVEAALDHAFECRGKLNEIEKNIGRGK